MRSHFLDCLGAPHARTGPFGTGRYPKEIIPPPPALAGITRRYGRYGISEAAFRAAPGPGPHPRRHPGDLPHDLLVPRGGRGHPPGPGALPRSPRHPGRDLRHPVPGARPKTQRRRSGGGRPGRSGILGILEEITGFSPSGPRSRTRQTWTPCPIRPWTSWTTLSFIPILTSRGCPLDCDLLRLPAAAAGLPAPRPPGGGGGTDVLAGPLGPVGRGLLR